MLGVRKIKEQEKLRKENLKNILGPEIFSSMEDKGIIPSYVGRVRTHHTNECKDFCLLGFGEKRPKIVLVNNENDFSLVQLSI